MFDNNNSEIENESNTSENTDFLSDANNLDTSNTNEEIKEEVNKNYGYENEEDAIATAISKLANVDSTGIKPPYISDINDNDNIKEEKQTTPIPSYIYNKENNLKNNQEYQTPKSGVPVNSFTGNQSVKNAPIDNVNANNNLNNNPYNFNISGNKDSKPEKSGKSNAKNIFMGIITAIVIVIVTGFLGASIYNDFIKKAPADGALPDVEKVEEDYIKIDETKELDGGLLATEIYKKVSPSVIGIQAYIEGVLLSEGSGVIMSKDGKIMTNSHVVHGADTIKVSFLNENSYSAKILGTDQSTDLAVIQLIDFKEGDEMPVAEFGDSTNLLIGDRVFAIGNPGGMDFAGSLTQGIVSNVNRKVSDQMGFSIRAIQVDAAINPGNSGGALINGHGQVIGITSSKIAGASYEGMGFAIPIHEATPIINDLINEGRVVGRPRIGITYIPNDFIDTKTAAEYGLKTGIRIYEIDETSDAYKKGLRVNDIIHKVDGKVLQHVEDLSTFMEGKVAGDPLEFTVFRKKKDQKGEEMVINIILDEDMS